MQLAARYGVWRSSLGDTWPHDGTIEMDFWPQGTHLVDEAPLLVLCASGAGGGSQQAMFRAQLDPLLQRALARWHRDRDLASTVAALGQLFEIIQQEFQELRTPSWAEQFQASAVACLLGKDTYAIANIGVERAWLLREGKMTQVTQDFTLRDAFGAGLPEPIASQPGSFFGRFGEGTARWHVTQGSPRSGDVLVLASGLRDTGIDEAVMATEVRHALCCDAFLCPPTSNRQREDGAATQIGARLAEIVSAQKDAAARKRAYWRLHSRLALGVVQITEATE